MLPSESNNFTIVKHNGPNFAQNKFTSIFTQLTPTKLIGITRTFSHLLSGWQSKILKFLACHFKLYERNILMQNCWFKESQVQKNGFRKTFLFSSLSFNFINVDRVLRNQSRSKRKKNIVLSAAWNTTAIKLPSSNSIGYS